MARRIILKENGLENTSPAPIGQIYIGYDQSIFSERDQSSTSEIASGTYYQSDGNIIDNLAFTASTTETAIYSYKIPANFYNVGDMMTAGPAIVTFFTFVDPDTNPHRVGVMKAYWSYSEGGLDNLVEQVTIDVGYYPSDRGYSHIFNTIDNGFVNESGFILTPFSKITSNTELCYISEQSTSPPYDFNYATSSIADITKDIYFTLTFELTAEPEGDCVVKLGLIKAIRDLKVGQLFGFTIGPFSSNIGLI